MIEPTYYSIEYVINPWMNPTVWASDITNNHYMATQAWRTLRKTLVEFGANVHVLPGIENCPDMVFAANSAVVLNGKAFISRFRYPERQKEELHLGKYFYQLGKQHKLIQAFGVIPKYLVQEGVADAIWDDKRQIFWTGYGQRSTQEASKFVGDFFQQGYIALELATKQFYHLDTCFCCLSGGEILFYPGAFTQNSLQAIRDLGEFCLELNWEEAHAFGANAICLGKNIIVPKTPSTRLIEILSERGYNVTQLDLSPFILAGGAAACLTLNLSLKSEKRVP